MKSVSIKLVLATLGAVLLGAGLHSMLGENLEAFNPLLLVGAGLFLLLFVKGKIGFKL